MNQTTANESILLYSFWFKAYVLTLIEIAGTGSTNHGLKSTVQEARRTKKILQEGL